MTKDNKSLNLNIAVNYGFKNTIPLIFGVFFGVLSVLTLSLLGIGEI